MSKFSIILPTYNSAKHLEACVNSILCQTYPEFDLIILDSFSSDNTLPWLYSLKNEKIKIYPVHERLFIAENWARIRTIPRNEFMTIIGHDDILKPQYLEEMNMLIQKHPNATLYQSHFDFINVDGKFLNICSPMDAVQEAHEFLACLMAKTLDSTATGYMFRSKDYDKVGGISTAYPDLLFADNELWIKLITLSYKATTITNCFSYRIHQSLSRTTTGMDYYQSFSQYIFFLKELAQENRVMKDVITRYGKEMLNEYCEAVAHRLLKTPARKRAVTVKTFLSECKQYGDWLIPGQNFNPLNNRRIKLAELLDSNRVLRQSFQLIRKYYSGKL